MTMKVHVRKASAFLDLVQSCRADCVSVPTSSIWPLASDPLLSSGE